MTENALPGGNAGVHRMMLSVAIALLPATLANAFATALVHPCSDALVNVSRALSCIALCLGTTTLCDVIVRKLRGHNSSQLFADASAFVIALIIAIMLPNTAPWYLPVSASAFAVILGKEAFGGLGNNPFNPAMTGVALGFTLLPNAFVEPPAVADTSWHFSALTWLPLSAMVSLALTGGGLFLLSRRVISWHGPFGMLSMLAAPAAYATLTFGAGSNHGYTQPFHWFSATTLLCAWFVITDPVTGATTRLGQLLFGALVGALSVAMLLRNAPPVAAAFAVLLANAAVPWIDRLTLRPPAAFRKHQRQHQQS